eukprot:TRINITY_DN137866_c0_g1_i1.p1 TRINITY_DN137866_c0_g1~~TRINITY_DN137866_c0_g1_i1.p1  ORF type:complete len:191 (-),score=12.95 TRINITY_DN137866_c0_g1_i1:286-858(-)
MYELPALPYALNALEPHITEQQLTLHYKKHHAGYVTKLNGLREGISPHMSLEELIKKESGVVYNNAAQIWNHSFYWDSMSPAGGGPARGAIAAKINSKFGSFESFKQQFSKAGMEIFGSGWLWLVKTEDGCVNIISTKNAENPLQQNSGKPLITLDVWEHAYYAQYSNRRAEYIDAWWNLVNWDFANSNL